MRLVILKAGSLKGKALLLCLVSTLFIFLFYRGVHNIVEGVSSIEIFSEGCPGKVIIKDRPTLKKIQREISDARVSACKETAKRKFVMIVKRKSRTQMFWFDEPGELYEVRNGKIYKLEDRGRCLQEALKRLEEKNRFGEFITWSQVRQIFKKYDKARIIDMETGMSFMVQRRAGSEHADVQPLTAEDSDVMKMIYGGKWSWKRRAVIVDTGGHRLAGSMNGMPHGAGAIGGNKFNGHFCIHFRDSRLHSKKEDPAHQLMVWKAAGVTDKMMANAEPAKVLEVMLTALEQGDVNLALKFIESNSENERTRLTEQLKSIRWITVAGAPEQTTKKNDSARVSDVSTVKVSYRVENGAEYKNRLLSFRAVKSKGPILWKISSEDVLNLFEKPSNGEELKEDKSETTYKEDQFYREL
ncbi:MAG TPA: hypothetical protein VNT57_05725 [Desulfobacteria bacterium]|nr:hypothetical protein [Desulfobacteria bacterium]